jgi:di/tricarboxylate transporter
MVMGRGGYRFGDYRKLGLPMIVVFFAVSVGLVPLVWHF